MSNRKYVRRRSQFTCVQFNGTNGAFITDVFPKASWVIQSETLQLNQYGKPAIAQPGDWIIGDSGLDDSPIIMNDATFVISYKLASLED